MATAARPTAPSLIATQRRLVTLWFQASRNVPVSSSLAISGAPQKIPMSAGTASAEQDHQQVHLLVRGGLGLLEEGVGPRRAVPVRVAGRQPGRVVQVR